MGTPIRRVRLVLPSSPVPDPAALEAGVAWLRANGVDVLPPLDGGQGPLAHLAGSDEHRAAALLSALEEPQVDAVWCGRGGSGALRTLDALDAVSVGALARSPARPLIGLSDATALLLARHRCAGLAVHGPVITQLARLDEASQEALLAWLNDPQTPPALAGRAGQGRAEGPLVAGNLALLSSVCGTPEQPDLSGRLLLLEEIGEPTYRVDRMIAQLARAGALEGLRGLALGTFEGCHETVETCLIQWAERLGVPWCAGLPVGHGAACVPVVLGVEYTLDGVAGQLTPSGLVQR